MKGCLQFIGGAVVLFFGFVFFCAVVGSSSSTKPSKAAINTTAPKGQPELKEEPRQLVLKPGWAGRRTSYGGYEVTGVVVNKMGRDLGYAQISIQAYDKSGAQVDTTMANTNNLEANGRWKFKAVGLHEGEIDHFKVGNLSGF